MTLTRDAVRWALGVRDAGLPPAIMARTRMHIADTLGIAIAAQRHSAIARQVSSVFRSDAISGNAWAPGAVHAQGPCAAAFENAARMHLLDYDDIHDDARLHPTTVTLAAALAVAAPQTTSLDALATAVAIGNELAIRLGVACAPKGAGPGADWFLTQLFGYFSAALSSALLLDLSERDIVSALGLAYMQAAGGKEAGFGVGATARAIYPAFAAQGGVQAVMVARAGIVGPAAALEGRAGLFRTYLGLDPATAAPVLLESHAWHFDRTAIKPWPCCRFGHPYIDAALRIREATGDPSIERVVAAVNRTTAKLCSPLAERRRPVTLQDAKYSVPFLIAFALVHGGVDIDTLNDEALKDAAVLALAQRVEIDESLPDGTGLPPAELHAIIGGTTHHAVGSSTLSLDEAACERKFLRCVGAGAFPASEMWQALRLSRAMVGDVPGIAG